MSTGLGVDDYFGDGGTVRELQDATIPFADWYDITRSSADSVGAVKALADAIITLTCFAQDAGERLYRYQGGVYRPDGAAFVKAMVKRLLEEQGKSESWSSHRASEVVEYIRVDAARLWDRPPLDVVNLRNGLLDVATRQLRPHASNHLSTVQVPVLYDPHASCPGWDKFVEDVFPSDAPVLAFEVVGHLMLPDTSIQKAVLLLGEGGNGKSTYLTAVQAFLGKENVATLSLHKLESDRFAVARLVGKLATSLPSEHLAGTSMFKAITGGDRIPAEYKYRDSFDFTPFARLLFSANHPPRTADSSQAFFDRWDVVPFTRLFRGTDKEVPRAVLDARLAEPTELSGVLNRALDALEAMGRRGRFTESASMAAAYAEFRQITDPLAVWLDRGTVEGPDAFVLKSKLHAAYNDAAEHAGRPPLTSTAFGLALRRLRPNLGEAQRTIAGKVQRVWLGIGLRSNEHFEVHDEEAEASPDSLGSRSSRGSVTLSSAGNLVEKEEREESQEIGLGKPREPRELRERGSEPPLDVLGALALALWPGSRLIEVDAN